MSVSVILCTHNRGESLRQTLATFRALETPPRLEWELIVVDNNSRDHTRQVCDEFAGTLPIRYLFEPRQGLSVARNRAIRETTSELLAFTDDDLDMDPGWLACLWAAAKRHPEATFFGGKILPRWEKDPPRWLIENSARISGVTMHFDKGDTERIVAERCDLFYGANMAFRRSVFANGRHFREDLGFHGNSLTPGEETHLMQELLAEGQRGCYAPAAIVHHRNPPYRMTETYLRRWFKGEGIVQVRRGEVEVGAGHLWFKVSRWYWKTLFLSALKYAVTRWTCAPPVWLTAEIRMASTWGTIVECRRQMRR